MAERPDGELLRRARDGSADAARDLFRRHWPATWKAAYAVLGNRALAAAEHGVQRAGGVELDWGDARVAGMDVGGFRDNVRAACGAGFEQRTVAVSVVHPHVERFSASLSQETFLLARTGRGWVVWAQVH
jgi:hypothetical protein